MLRYGNTRRYWSITVEAVTDLPMTQPTGTNRRRVIPSTCIVHGGSRGYTNLVVRELDGTIELDPHATGAA